MNVLVLGKECFEENIGWLYDKMSTISVVIPARLESSRLPCKVLAGIRGKPMLRHVWEKARLMNHCDELYVATDDKKICDAALSWGARVIMTARSCQSGTERVASIVDQLNGDFILGIQADMPFIHPLLLDQLVNHWKDNQSAIVTPVYQIHDTQSVLDPNIVKVVLGVTQKALYFSRGPLPYIHNVPVSLWLQKNKFWGHVGVYGFQRNILMGYAKLTRTHLEQTESLEQLRLIENGYTIQTIQTNLHSGSVDTQADLETAQNS